MLEKDTKYVEEIIDSISHYQDDCYACPHYRHGDCGFAFPDQRYPDGKTIYYENYVEMEYEERKLCDTKMTGEPCSDQPDSVTFLNSIESDLEKIPSGIDEDSLNIYLRRLYRIMVKHKNTDPLMANTSIRSDVEKAIQLLLAKFDLDALEEGVSILRLIKATKLGYSRKEGLFQICPEDMAIPLIKKSIVQTPVGYYLGNGEYEADDEDTVIKLDHFLGKEWNEASQALSFYNTMDTLSKVSAPPEKETVSAVEKYVDFLTGIKVTEFLHSLLSSLYNNEQFELESSIGMFKFVERFLDLTGIKDLPSISKVADELKKEIAARKDDEHQLTIYVSELLSRFYWLSRNFLADTLSGNWKILRLVNSIASLYQNYPFTVFLDKYHEADEEASALFPNDTEKYFAELFNLLSGKYYDSDIHDGTDDVLMNFSSLWITISHFESALEGALLVNGVDKDLQYYQDMCRVPLIGSVSEQSVSHIIGLTPSTIENLAIKYGHRIHIDVPNDIQYEIYKSKADSDDAKETVISSVDEDNDEGFVYLPPEKRPALKPNYGIADIPLSGVDDVDALSKYYFDADKYVKYYARDAIERFRKLCYAKTEDKSLSTKDRKIWAVRIMQTLDSVYALSDIEGKPMKRIAQEMMVILECAFMQMAEPVCIKKIGIENDLTVIFRRSIPTGGKEMDIYDVTAAERFYDTYNEIGGNAILFERQMCDNCDLLKCPYRNIMSKHAEMEIPEEYPQDILTARGAANPDSRSKLKKTLPEDALKAFLDSVMTNLGKEYAEKVDDRICSWKFRKQATLVAYLGIRIKEHFGLGSIPWGAILRQVKISTKGDESYLKSKASKMKSPKNYPDGYQDVDAAIAKISSQ